MSDEKKVLDERTPKAKQLIATMKATMNLDLDDLIQSGVIEGRDGQECSPWTKWNADAPKFIIKLGDRELNSLAALIAHKFPDAFAAPINASDRDRAEKAEARVKVLEAALEPFASRELKGNYMTVSVYASDIRAARAAKEQS